jgi:hypothetical protein
MQVQELISMVREQPDTIDFKQVIATIDAHYQHTPTHFHNGELENAATTNQGSCKVLGFAQLNGLSESETLALFGAYYRDDVLGNPDGTDHGNIRNFMTHGWERVKFETPPLKALET